MASPFTGGELAAAISCRLELREHRRPHPWFSISRIALNGGAGANDITACRPGVVVALHVVRGRRERVANPLVDYQHRPAVGEYRPHRAVQAVPIGPGRDRRGDHALAEEQCGAEEAQRGQRHGGATTPRPAVPAQQRDERHDLPPPSLPARITSVRVTMIIIDQKINDTRPYTLSVLIGTGSGWLRLKAVWMVVGLVPMSPNTTPSAPPKLQCKTGRSGLGSSRPNPNSSKRGASLAIRLDETMMVSCPDLGCG